MDEQNADAEATTVVPTDTLPVPPPIVHHGDDEMIDVTDRPYHGPFDFEIVGLQMSSNGRSCCSHQVCGVHLKKGDVIKIIPTIIQNNDETEEALIVARVIDAEVRCRVGFVPRVQATVLKRRFPTNIGQYAIVKDIYIGSSIVYKEAKSKRNYGMASCLFINNIANFEDELE